MLFLKFILAMIPIIWLIIALSKLKMPSYKACGIAFFALTFVLLALTGESGEVMARRKKVQVLAEEKRISSAMRKTASDAAGKMRIASFGGGTR